MKDNLKIKLLLIELIISIFLFIITITICIQPFIISYNKSIYSNKLNESIFIAQSYAEIYKSNNGNINKVLEYYNINKQEIINKDLEIIFNNNDTNINILNIIIKYNNNIIYELNTSIYNPKIGEDNEE